MPRFLPPAPVGWLDWLFVASTAGLALAGGAFLVLGGSGWTRTAGWTLFVVLIVDSVVLSALRARR